jgi:hypothetical protein
MAREDQTFMLLSPDFHRQAESPSAKDERKAHVSISVSTRVIVDEPSR